MNCTIGQLYFTVLESCGAILVTKNRNHNVTVTVLSNSDVILFRRTPLMATLTNTAHAQRMGDRYCITLLLFVFNSVHTSREE